ncbi:hypothetical protein CNMCM5793_006145 [Aspergillus hiratsukae]|uniref:RING-type domain-containing protein n=1 Tax=Aspergillus hiratsukae TaxID=1194566 RepID=A0A8H6UAQ0_9EURO|nr:hypothetical protein CNMCM5793_006145 [Aspergillus hiratsukae]KAF7168596.1 hypothetical protein CNMCM6106_003755 [Aspergillus hiratsukae]
MSYPHLQTILEVYPQCSTHCYGYAPSKHRRCKLPTRQANRNKASHLLEHGTHLLQRGSSVDNLLSELAPLLLCSRLHKNQVDRLVSVWRAKLQAFEEQRLQCVLVAVLKSLREYADSRASELAEQRVEGAGLRPARPAGVGTAEEEEEEEEGGGDREEAEPEPSSVRTSTEASAPAVPRAVEEPTVPRSERRTITRKPIEGDCEICMCPLREGDSEASDDEDDNDVSDTAPDNEDDGPEEDDDDLVYCKNQCGSNYHKACIDEWLATQTTFREPRGNPICPSCPTCRAVWSS